MRDNIMFIPAVILMIVEALALGFLVWSWFIDLIDQQPTIKEGKENLCRIVDGECTECGWFGDCVEARCHNFCPGCGKKVMRDESGKDNDR